MVGRLLIVVSYVTKQLEQDIQKTRNGTKKFLQQQFWEHWFYEFGVTTHISYLILNANDHSILLPSLILY